MIDENFVNGADRDLGGAAMVRMDSPAAWRARMMRRVSVSTTTRGPAADAAAGAGGGEPVAGLADDVAAAVLGPAN